MKKTWRLDLAFRAQCPERTAGDLPASAAVSIKNYSNSEHLYKEPDLLLISNECLSIGEFDSEIDNLHQELEAIRKEAHRRFEASRKEVRIRHERARPLP
ncbi:MAG: hypothetical protein ACHQZS_08070 [Candidatus Binatales bacterium]